MDLCVTVVAAGNAVVCPGCHDLLILQPTVSQALLFEPGLEKPSAPATAVVVGPVGLHIDKILFTHHRLDHKPQIVCNGIAIAFPDNLAGVLYREFYAQILVPVGIDPELTLPDPFGVIFINIFYFKVMFQVEFFQSRPD